VKLFSLFKIISPEPIVNNDKQTKACHCVSKYPWGRMVLRTPNIKLSLFGSPVRVGESEIGSTTPIGHESIQQNDRTMSKDGWRNTWRMRG
jgi:hypothetical protein